MAEQGLVFAGDRGVAPGGQSALLSSDTPLTLSGGLMAAVHCIHQDTAIMVPTLENVLYKRRCG